jgi:hypothetical protein
MTTALLIAVVFNNGVAISIVKVSNMANMVDYQSHQQYYQRRSSYRLC